MCTYILDISEVNREDFEALGKMPDKIECSMGIFEKEFDLKMDTIPDEAIEHARQYYEDKYGEAIENKPIGFDARDLPVGAKLERIE